jgi:hypothetical protein
MSAHLEKLMLFLDNLVLQLLSLAGLKNDILTSQTDNINYRHTLIQANLNTYQPEEDLVGSPTLLAYELITL